MDIKEYKSTARWRNTQGKVPNKGASVLEFGASTEAHGSIKAINLEDLWTLSSLGFYWGFIT